MESITLPVYNREGKEVDTVKLDAAVFDGKINTAVIYRVVNAYLANQRQGLAATKTRGEVSGGGRKPWKQKGTGRARAGSTRSPLWRHGGVVFGPHPRDFSRPLPKKLKNLALCSAFVAKAKENNFIVVENLTLDKPNTKEALKLLTHLKVNLKKKPHDKVLLLLDKISPNMRLAMRNIGLLNLNLAKDTNAFEVMESNKLIITRDALGELTKRLQK